MNHKLYYYAYLCEIESNTEIKIGYFKKLSAALAHARCANKEQGTSKWDWVVEKRSTTGELINRRSSIAGLENNC